MKIRRIVVSALFAAIICVATIVIKIPSPMNGYINIGDAAVLLAAWMLLRGGYAFLSAAVGSALADLISAYLVYAPATFLIKGLMALVAYLLFKQLSKHIRPLPSYIISGAAAEVVMVLGYYIFEGFVYGFVPSLVNIPANVIQGAVGLLVGVIVAVALRRSKIDFE